MNLSVNEKGKCLIRLHNTGNKDKFHVCECLNGLQGEILWHKSSIINKAADMQGAWQFLKFFVGLIWMSLLLLTLFDISI